MSVPAARSYQLDFVNFARGKKAALAGHEMGTGKSKGAIIVLDEL